MKTFTAVRPPMLTALFVGIVLLGMGLLEARQLSSPLWPPWGDAPWRPAKSVLEPNSRTEPSTPAPTPVTMGMRAPEQIISELACAACHDFTGPERSVGPSLWDIGVRAEEEYIRQSILVPNAAVADGYPANVMPQDLAEYMTAAEFERLVQWLKERKGPPSR